MPPPRLRLVVQPAHMRLFCGSYRPTRLHWWRPSLPTQIQSRTTKQMARAPRRSFDNAARLRSVLSQVPRPVVSRRLPSVDSYENQSRKLLARRSDRQLIHIMRFKLFPSRGVKLPCLLRFNMSGIRSKQERKMATQNPNRLRTNCPGGSLTLGGDTTVNRLGFGAMRLCGPGVWGEPLDRPAAKRVLMRAVELGITLVDTADAYGPEVNERFIAETLYPYPKGLIIATKGGLQRPRR